MISDNWAIRFDTSTPEQEKLERLMFDKDKFLESFDYEDFNKHDEDANGENDLIRGSS